MKDSTIANEELGLTVRCEKVHVRFKRQDESSVYIMCQAEVTPIQRLRVAQLYYTDSKVSCNMNCQLECTIREF